ncbi:hypothetical protein L7F22_050489 [Adiantum nelumboides]|nr:hypothetical protein [Adiantum nelumboides]
MDSQTSQQTATVVASSQPPVQYAVAATVQGPMTSGFQTPVVVPPPAIIAGQPAVAYAPVPQAVAGYQHVHQQQLQQFWTSQMQEVQQVTEFKIHQLPLARIKKIMKADEDVRMIAAEAPVLFAKACEMFISELTLRSWIHTEENKRRTLQKNDIAAAITRTDIFDFLVDIVPRDELKDEGLGVTRAGVPVGAPADPLYGGMYYMAPGGCGFLPQPPGIIPMISQPPPPMMASPGIIVGRPAMAVDPTVYRHGVAFPPQPASQVWQQPTQDVQTEAPESSS